MEELDLTQEEAEVLEYTIFKRLCRLEECGLTDSYCYPRLYSARQKLKKKYNLTKNYLQPDKKVL